MIYQLKENDEEIFKLKSNIKLLKVETCKATRIKEEMESSLAKENEEIFKMKSDIISLKIEANEATCIKEEIEKRLAKKNNDCERLEEEIVSLRKEVEGMEIFLKTLKPWMTCSDIKYPHLINQVLAMKVNPQARMMQSIMLQTTRM